MSKNKTGQSKLLSLILRHQPEIVGIELDAQGWVDVDRLVSALDAHGHGIDRTGLERIVRESDKQRFAFSEDGRRIRANQGHSVEVDLALAPETPPDLLYHGTVDRFLGAIRAQGLIKRDRHHVHLTADRDVAVKVGERRGVPIVLDIDAEAMHRKGCLFFRSANGVWLVDHVPTHYIKNGL